MQSEQTFWTWLLNLLNPGYTVPVLILASVSSWAINALIGLPFGETFIWSGILCALLWSVSIFAFVILRSRKDHDSAAGKERDA